jgi:hypothetical protein
MNLEDVDVIHFKSFQTCFHGFKDMFPAQSFSSIMIVGMEPCLLMYSFVVAGEKPATPPYGSSLTVPKHLVRITNFSLGMLYFLIAFAMRTSEIPLCQRWGSGRVR